MPVELRKRKAVEPAPAPPAKKKNPISKAVAKVKGAVSGESKSPHSNGAAKPGKVAVGDTIDLKTFGGEVETHDGQKTTLKKLADESKGGVVLFTYPKASTPGCTNQACMFRDSYEPLTSTGFSIFGLSTDSPKANTSFKNRQNLPYPLLCDPNATLISAIGMKKAPKGTTRGVFVIEKSGKVLAAEPGGPGATVEVVKKLVGTTNGATVSKSTEAAIKADEPAANTTAVNGNGTEEPTKEDLDKAAVAADVADTAEKIDSNEAKAAEATV